MPLIRTGYPSPVDPPFFRRLMVFFLPYLAMSRHVLAIFSLQQLILVSVVVCVIVSILRTTSLGKIFTFQSGPAMGVLTIVILSHAPSKHKFATSWDIHLS